MEEVDGDWVGDGEAVSVFFDGDGGGFDGFDGVEEAVEFHEAVKTTTITFEEDGYGFTVTNPITIHFSHIK